MLSAKIVVVIIWRDWDCIIINYLIFYSNMNNSEFFCFSINKYGGIQDAESTGGFIYNRSPFKNIYTILYSL